MKEYSLYCKFDIEKHKRTFINYFEAIILPDGTVEYAVPSHIEKLIALTGEDRETIANKMPTSEMPLEWLIEYTGCIAVWSGFHVGIAKTKEQERMLQRLIAEKLMK